MLFENEIEQKEEVKAQELSNTISTTQSFKDRRIPYNMQKVMESLLRKLI
jgi:hypothetical protein